MTLLTFTSFFLPLANNNLMTLLTFTLVAKTMQLHNHKKFTFNFHLISLTMMIMNEIKKLTSEIEWI